MIQQFEVNNSIFYFLKNPSLHPRGFFCGNVPPSWRGGGGGYGGTRIERRIIAIRRRCIAVEKWTM